jgi:hypothetical protein
MTVARKAVKKGFADLRKELTELKRKLKTEEDFTASYIRRLHESEKKREEWQALAENTMDASSEGAWMARALDAERGLAGLRAELELAHKFHDIAVKERNHARYLLGEVLAVLNGDGGQAVQELGWGEATKRGIARHNDMLARSAGLGAITKTEV